MIHRAVSSPLLFDKRTLKMCLICLMITPFCIGQPQDCIQRNNSCVEAPNGFTFRHECPPGNDFSIETIDDNKTVIATSHPFIHSSEVLHMDNDSVTIQRCQSLRVKCTTSDGEKHIKEKCLDFKMTSPDPIDSPKPWGYIGLGVGVIFVIAVGFPIIWGYKSWKNDVRRQTTPSFSQYLLTCFGLRKELFLTGREVRHPQGNELKEVTVDDTKTQQNGDVGNVISPDRDPRGCGENEGGKENPLENGHIHSIDSKADGKTPQSLGLDHNFRNETIQQTRNDDISAPKVNREAHHPDLNRNLKDDDPGGANSNERKDTIGKTTSGWADGDHNAEDHETEGRPLLPNQRADIQGFDMTGEATALVNKPGFDPDQVSGGSVAPETDVESTHNMKN